MNEFPKHMMATQADHKLGDLSRAKPALARVESIDPETGEYMGAWAYGFGFIGVKFPAETTRDLTTEEVLSFEKGYIKEPGMPPQPVKILGYDHIERPKIIKPKLDLDHSSVVIDGVTVPLEKIKWAQEKVETNREIDTEGDDPNVYTTIEELEFSAAAIVAAAEGRSEILVQGIPVSPELVERAWQAAAYRPSTSFNLGKNDQGEDVIIDPTTICKEALGTSPSFWDNLGR